MPNQCPAWLLLALLVTPCIEAQTTLYDFQDFDDPFGHFGAITTEAGLLQDCGEVGNVCATHTGDFTASIFNPNDFGMVEVGPFFGPETIDLSGFVGYQIDARFVRTDVPLTPSQEAFSGMSPIKFGVQWDPDDPCNGTMDQCSDLYAEPVELTEEFQTYTVLFADFLEDNPRDSAQLKMLMLTGEFDGSTNAKLSDWSDGVGRLEIDNIIGILPLSGDYNFDGVVDAADYTVWRDSFGSTTELAADGSGNGEVGDEDYDIWAANYGSSAALSSAIPEPSSLLLLAAFVGVSSIATRRS